MELLKDTLIHSERIRQGKFVRGQIQSVLWILEGGYVKFLTNVSIFGTLTPFPHKSLWIPLPRFHLYSDLTNILWRTMNDSGLNYGLNTSSWWWNSPFPFCHFWQHHPILFTKCTQFSCTSCTGLSCTFLSNTWRVSWWDLSRFEVGFWVPCFPINTLTVIFLSSIHNRFSVAWVWGFLSVGLVRN